MLRNEPPNRLKTLIAEDVLHPAGILCSDLRRNIERSEPLRKECVPLVDTLSDLSTRFRKRNMSMLVHKNVSRFAQFFHCDTDTGLGKIQICRNIDRVNIRAFPIQCQDRFQIVLRRFLDLQFDPSLF